MHDALHTSLPFLLLLLSFLALAAYIALSDLASMEVPAWAMFAFVGVSLAFGLLHPLSGQSPWVHLATFAMALVGAWGLNRLFRWRHGHDGLGEADILFLGGAGAVLGLDLFGPFLLVTAAFGALCNFTPLLARARRLAAPAPKARPDDEPPYFPFLPIAFFPLIGVVAAGLIFHSPT